MTAMASTRLLGFNHFCMLEGIAHARDRFWHFVRVRMHLVGNLTRRQWLDCLRLFDAWDERQTQADALAVSVQ